MKTNLQRDLFPTTLGTHSVGIHSFLFMFLDFLCIYFLNEPAFGRRLHEANAATKINSIYLLKKNLLEAESSKPVCVYIYIYACMQGKMNILKTKSFDSTSHALSDYQNVTRAESSIKFSN